MDLIHKAIDRVIGMIDWAKIKGYHKKLGIRWEFNCDKEIVHRIPNIPELKHELYSLLTHMNETSLNYISHGNWIVFWDRDKFSVGDIRVIFRIVDFHFEDNTESRESIETALKEAINREDYEYAAVLRDSLYKKEKPTE